MHQGNKNSFHVVMSLEVWHRMLFHLVSVVWQLQIFTFQLNASILYFQCDWVADFSGIDCLFQRSWHADKSSVTLSQRDADRSLSLRDSNSAAFHPDVLDTVMCICGLQESPLISDILPAAERHGEPLGMGILPWSWHAVYGRKALSRFRTGSSYARKPEVV